MTTPTLNYKYISNPNTLKNYRAYDNEWNMLTQVEAYSEDMAIAMINSQGIINYTLICKG